LIFLSAPLISKSLTILVLLISSALFTARWRGVRPKESWLFISVGPQANRY